jgi:hypothetical protein
MKVLFWTQSAVNTAVSREWGPCNPMKTNGLESKLLKDNDLGRSCESFFETRAARAEERRAAVVQVGFCFLFMRIEKV